MVYSVTRPALDYYERRDSQNIAWRDEMREKILDTVMPLPPPLPAVVMGVGWTAEGDRAYRWQGPQDGDPELTFSGLLQDHRYRVTFHLSQFEGDGALTLRLGDTTDVVAASVEGFYVETADIGVEDSSCRLIVSTGGLVEELRILGLVIEDLGQITEVLTAEVSAWAANMVVIDVAGGKPAYTVDWGDGVIETSTDATFAHTYATTGNKQIEVGDPDGKTFTLHTHVPEAIAFPALLGSWTQIAGAGFHLDAGALPLTFGPYEPGTPVNLSFALWGADAGAGDLEVDLGSGTPALTLDLTTPAPVGHVIGGFVGENGYVTFDGPGASGIQIMEVAMAFGDAP